MKALSIIILLWGIAAMVFVPEPACSQTDNSLITGKVVTSDDSKPLSGATVTIKGSNAATTTDSAGTFKIKAAPTDVLLASFVGYSNVEMPVGSGADLVIRLNQNIQYGDEVVVIGYGTQKKSSVTGAVAKISSAGLNQIPVARADYALQGKFSGVQIQTVDASAGAAPKIQIRGAASINASSGPLIVIDGYPVPTDLSSVNMNEVASIEVLKDAASAAIYGSRGANGVILITTKSGIAGATKISVNAYAGLSSVYRRLHFPSLAEWSAYAAAENNGVLSDQLLTAARFNAYTDPQDVVFQQGSAQNFDISARGGSASGTRFFVAASVQKTNGVLVTNQFDRYSLRANLDFKISPKFDAGVSLNPSYAVRQDPSVPTYQSMRTLVPFLPVYHTDSTAFYTGKPVGSIVQPRDFDPARNPYYKNTGLTSLATTGDNNGLSQLLGESNMNYQLRVITSAYLKFTISKDLSFRTSFGGFTDQQETEVFRQSWAKKDVILDGSAAAIASTYGQNTRRNVYDLLNENILNYKHSFGNHDLDAIAGFTAQSTYFKYSDIQAGNFLTDKISTLNAGTISSASTTSEQSNLQSYLFRVNYAYADKYLLSVASRTDGSSRFGTNKKWGYFPAFSAGWVVSKESFMENSRAINSLKIRGSYGATGNNNIGNYTSFARATPVAAILGNNTTQGFDVTSYGNADLTWERTFASNIGFDAGIFNNRVQLTMDYYNATTDKLLLYLPIPTITGYDGFWTNQGKVNNRGLEYAVTVTPVSGKDFRWTVTIAGTTLKNTLKDFGGVQEIISSGDPKRQNFFIARVGSPLVQFYGYEYDSVASIRGTNYWPIGVTAERVFAKDQNKDGVIDSKDRVTLGSPYPTFTWGLTNEFKYKNFDVSFVLQGSHGAKIYNIDPNYFEGQFSPTGATAYLNYPAEVQAQTAFKTLSSYNVQDASFIALRNLNIGYNFGANLSKKMGLSTLRVYFTSNNLWYKMAGNYTSYNPEGISAQINGVNASPLQFGYQRGSAPISRTLAFGINAEF